MDCRAEGCAQHVFRAGEHLVLQPIYDIRLAICESDGQQRCDLLSKSENILCVSPSILRLQPDEQANARYPALPATSARLLAIAADRKQRPAITLHVSRFTP